MKIVVVLLIGVMVTLQAWCYRGHQSATRTDFALSDYTVEDVSDTQFGRQLMGKMR